MKTVQQRKFNFLSNVLKSEKLKSVDVVTFEFNFYRKK